MIGRKLFYQIILLLITSTTVFSQKEKAWNYIPKTVLNHCDSLIISEIGKKSFTTHVVFNKHNSHLRSEEHEKTGIEHYILYYTFLFSGTEGPRYEFQLDYFNNQGQISVYKEIVFERYTRLPLSLQSKQLKIISAKEATAIALAADTLLKGKSLSAIIYPLAVTSNKKNGKNGKETYFTWDIFWEIEVGEEARSFDSHHVFVDAVTGEVAGGRKKK